MRAATAELPAILLYPQLFQDDLSAKVREFPWLFYHLGPTAAQVSEILGAPEVWPKQKK